MVALLRHQPVPGSTHDSSHGSTHGGGHLRLVVGEGEGPGRSGYRLRPDPATGQILGVSRRVDPSLVPTAPTVAVLGAVAVVALAVFGLLGVLRMVQGGPSAAVDGSVPAASAGSGAATADLAAGDRLLVVQPGDSLWTIALEIAPERDPRPLVVALAEANGGDSLQIGQQIVIPSQLLD